jgi:hypothetical protein
MNRPARAFRPEACVLEPRMALSFNIGPVTIPDLGTIIGFHPGPPTPSTVGNPPPYPKPVHDLILIRNLTSYNIPLTTNGYSGTLHNYVLNSNHQTTLQVNSNTSIVLRPTLTFPTTRRK